MVGEGLPSEWPVTRKDGREGVRRLVVGCVHGLTHRHRSKVCRDWWRAWWILMAPKRRYRRWGRGAA